MPNLNPVNETNQLNVLNDRYELGEELDRRGMGVLCRALDTVFDRNLAVRISNQAARSEFDTLGAPRYDERMVARIANLGEEQTK